MTDSQEGKTRPSVCFCNCRLHIWSLTGKNSTLTWWSAAPLCTQFPARAPPAHWRQMSPAFLFSFVALITLRRETSLNFQVQYNKGIWTYAVPAVFFVVGKAVTPAKQMQARFNFHSYKKYIITAICITIKHVQYQILVNTVCYWLERPHAVERILWPRARAKCFPPFCSMVFARLPATREKAPRPKFR